MARWGNRHCGDNKEKFVAGEAVRVVILGEARQIRMTGAGWLKSVHGSGAEFMPQYRSGSAGK